MIVVVIVTTTIVMVVMTDNDHGNECNGDLKYFRTS